MTDTTLRAKVLSATRLADAMRFRGLSNRGLAARTGLHRSTIGHLRTGARNRIGYLDAIRIAEALDMPTAQLFVAEVPTGALGERRAS